MGVIPTLLNMYHRNKRYRQQRKAYEQDKAEKQQDKMRQQALQTFQNQQRQAQSAFGQQSQPAYDPFRTLNQYFPE